MESYKLNTLIIGAGAAGLSAGYHLKRQGKSNFRIIENSGRYGGLVRGFNWHGFDCDLAPHRLFCKDKDILAELLALVECHKIKRNSAINLENKIITDPVQITELVLHFFPKSLKMVTDFIHTKIRTKTVSDNFYDEVKNIYGHTLAELFFRPYAEKLFGINAEQIDKSWAVRKVRVSGLKEMFKREGKLYFDYFYYPQKGGYGAFAHALAQTVEDHIQLNSTITSLQKDDTNNCYYCNLQTPQGQQQIIAKKIISTIPLPGLFDVLGKKINISYRGAKLVYVLVNKKRVMPYQWKYFVSKQIFINRISEFKNFYPQSETQQTVLCAEITNLEDYSAQAFLEILCAQLNLDETLIVDMKVIDIQHAYPIYQKGYQQIIDAANTQLSEHENLYILGRQAQFSHMDIDEIFKDAKTLINTEFT